MSASVKPLTANLAVQYAVFGMPGPRRRPEPVDAAGVDEDALVACDEQRKKRPGAVVHAPPVDRECSLPLLPAVGHEAAASADAGVAEHQVDMIGGVALEQLVAKAQHLRLVGDVADVAADPGRRPRRPSPPARGLRDRVGVPVAGRDRASLRRQLADQLAAHARAAAGHHRELPRERVHSPTPPAGQVRPARISRAGPRPGHLKLISTIASGPRDDHRAGTFASVCAERRRRILGAGGGLGACRPDRERGRIWRSRAAWSC